MANYAALILCMSAMLLTWAAAVVVIMGWGLLAQRAMGTRAGSLDDLLRAFWLGAVAWIGYLQIIHFVMPVGFLSLMLGAGIAINGWLLAGRQPIVLLGSTIRRHPVPAAFVGLVALFLAGKALGPSAIYDTGLYHMQAVRWNQAFPVVPGLGNLHLRLAFNNSCFLLQAQALLGPWRSAGFGIVNGLLTVALTAQASMSLVRIVRRQSDSYLADVIGSLLLLPVAVAATRSFVPYSLFIGSMSPDFTMHLFHFAALAYAARLLARPPDATTSNCLELCVLATSLLTAAVCIKVSAAPFALILFLALCGAVAIEWARSGRRWWHPVAVTVGVSCLLIVPWAARGVILSGYPLFPAELLSVDVPWRLPAGVAQATRETVLVWARGWGRSYAPGDPWLMHWLLQSVGRDVAIFCLPVGLTVLSGMMVLLRVRSGSASLRERWAMAVLLLATLAGLLTWWVTAPDPRYGFQLFYSLAICLAAWAIVAPAGANHQKIGRRLAWTLAVPVAVLLAFRVHYGVHLADMSLLKTMVGVTLPVPGTPMGYSVLPEVPLQGFKTDSGFVVHLPVNGDRVWDAPLPAAASPASLGLDLRYLRLRRDGDLGAGFVMAKPSETASADP